MDDEVVKVRVVCRHCDKEYDHPIETLDSVKNFAAAGGWVYYATCPFCGKMTSAKLPRGLHGG